MKSCDKVECWRNRMLIRFLMIHLMRLHRPSRFINNSSRLISGVIRLIWLLRSKCNNLQGIYRMCIPNQLDTYLHNLLDTWDNLRPPMASIKVSIPIILISNLLRPAINPHKPHSVLLNKPACRTIHMLNHNQNLYSPCQQAPTIPLRNSAQTSLPPLPPNN